MREKKETSKTGQLNSNSSETKSRNPKKKQTAHIVYK